MYTEYNTSIYGNARLKDDLIKRMSFDNNNKADTLLNSDIKLRFMEPNPFQIAIFIWVIGFVWQEFKQLFTSGMRVYLTAHSKSLAAIDFFSSM